MKTIWNIFNPRERKSVFILLFSIFIVSSLELLGLMLVIPYVDLMVDESQVVNYTDRFPVLANVLELGGDYRITISICFAGFYILKNAILGVFTYIQHTILKNVKANIMTRMFHHYLYRPYLFHVNVKTSELIRSITYDAFDFIHRVLQPAALFVSEALLFVGVVAVLIWKNPTALLVFLGMVIPVVLIYLVIRNRLVAWGAILQKRESDTIRHIQEGMGGIKEATVLGAQGTFENNFTENMQQQVRIKRNRDFVILSPRLIIETFMMVTMAVAFYWISVSGGLQENVATVAFLAIATVRIMPMSNRILGSINAIRSAKPSIDLVYGIAGNHAEAQDLKEKETDESPFESLQISNVSFSYSPEAKVLHDVSFNLQRGETVGIVGGSGSGKTTLVDVMLGLLPQNSGTIKCNGEPITDNLLSWQQRIGYVQQSVYLIDASIKMNIAFGIPKEDINDSRVEEVLSMAKLDDWVSSLPDSTESIVGERGVRISGGQRQRIGIARALYRDPELIVLDEATSSLDNATEMRIMEDVYDMKGQRTIIMIAHRLETIQRCDKIFVLDDGKIVDSGTYDSLRANSESFQNIANLQGEVQ